MAVTVDNGDLGRAIRRSRRARNMTIEGLAFAAEMHPTYLSAIERGVANPTWQRIMSLADALKTSVLKLVEDAQEEAQIAQAVRDARERIAAERD